MGSRAYSRSSSQPAGFREMDSCLLNVEIGMVDDSNLPWSFTAREQKSGSNERLADPPSSKCQLDGAAHLPVAAHFEALADSQSGKFMMIRTGRKRRINIVKLLLHQDRSDVATYLINHHNGMHAQLSEKLPQFGQFLNSTGEKKLITKAGDNVGVSGHRLPIRSAAASSDDGMSISNDADTTTYSSHIGPQYAKAFQNEYVRKQAMYVPQKTGVPEMKCDYLLKPAQLRKREPLSPNETSSCVSSASATSPSFNYSYHTAPTMPALLGINFPTTRLEGIKFHSFKVPIPGQVELCTVSNVIDNPHHFYVTLNDPALVTMQRRLQQKYSSRCFVDVLAKWKHTAFAAEVSGVWHRAIINSLYLGHTIEVFLVDCGLTSYVPKRAVRLLDKEDVALPPLAICCSLRGAYKWKYSPEQLSALFKDLGQVEATFVSKFGNEVYSTIITAADGNVLNLNILSMTSFEELKMVRTSTEQQKLRDGDKFMAKICGPWGKKICIHLENAQEDLKDVERQLANYSAKANLAEYFPKVGDYVHVFENPFHRRAVILSTNSGIIGCPTHASVFFVDAGYTKEVKVDSLQPLQEHFLLQPAIAIKCYVDETKPWPREYAYLMVKVICHRDKFPVLALDEPVQQWLIDVPISSSTNRDTKIAAAFENPLTLSLVPISNPMKSSPLKTELATITFALSSNMYFVRLAAKESQFAQLEAEFAKNPLQPVRGQLKEGEICLAFNKGRWLRAEVLPNGEALFFDYGHRGPIEKSMHLQPHLRDVESAAVLCSASSSNLHGLAEGVEVQVVRSPNANEIVGLANVRVKLN